MPDCSVETVTVSTSLVTTRLYDKSLKGSGGTNSFVLSTTDIVPAVYPICAITKYVMTDLSAAPGLIHTCSP